jgi:hypothetical protein
MAEELTAEELELLYQKAWGTPRPATTGPAAPPGLDPDDGTIVRERPDRRLLGEFPRDMHIASLVCSRKGRRREIGLVIGAHNIPVLVAAVGDVLADWGEDFEVECRCGLVHAIDGKLLVDAMGALPARRAGRVPTFRVSDVERVAT